MTIGWEEIAVRMGLHIFLRSIDAGVVALILLAALRVPLIRRRVSPQLSHALLWVGLVHFLLPRAPSFLPSELMARPSSLTLAELPRIAVLSEHLMLVAGLYLLGIFFVACIAWSQQRRTRRWSREFGDAVGARDAVRSSLARLGCERAPRIVLSQHVPAPMAMGVLLPTILLPSQLVAQVSARELDDVLAHELTHLQSRDPIWNLLRTVIVALWWFHPAAWLLAAAIRDVREECCDDAVLVRYRREPAHYAHSLVRAAEAISVSTPQWLSSSVTGSSRHPLAHRISRLGTASTPSLRLSTWGWAAGLLLLTVLWAAQPVHAVHRNVAAGDSAIYVHADGRSHHHNHRH